jgi:hypothetical protein
LFIADSAQRFWLNKKRLMPCMVLRVNEFNCRSYYADYYQGLSFPVFTLLVLDRKQELASGLKLVII